MTRESDLLLYVLVGGPLAVVGVLILFTGPLGWIVAGFVGIGVMVVRSLVQDGSDRGAETQNCTACGAPNAAADATCGYCGEAL